MKALARRYRAWRDHRNAVEYAVRDAYRRLLKPSDEG